MDVSSDIKLEIMPYWHYLDIPLSLSNIYKQFAGYLLNIWENMINRIRVEKIVAKGDFAKVFLKIVYSRCAKIRIHARKDIIQ